MPDAQQNVPQSAGTARGTHVGGGGHPEIRWAGQQHLMAGYCGRIGAAGRDDGAVAAVVPTPVRVVTLPQRPRDLVVRIGPKRQAEIAGVTAKAA